MFFFSKIRFDVVNNVSCLSFAFSCDKHHVGCVNADSLHLFGLKITIVTTFFGFVTSFRFHLVFVLFLLRTVLKYVFFGSLLRDKSAILYLFVCIRKYRFY